MDCLTSPIAQFYPFLTALVFGTLSFILLHELSRYLIVRWRSFQVIGPALEWIPILDQELIPIVQQYVEPQEENGLELGLSIQHDIERLRASTRRYALLLPTDSPGTNYSVL